MDYAFYFCIGLMVIGYFLSVANDRLDVDTFAHKAIDVLSFGLFIAGFILLLLLSVFFVAINKM